MAPAGSLAVISQSGETLSFFDVETGKRTDYIKDLIAEPHELCHDKQRGVLYISHTYRHGHYWVHGDYAHEISIFDLKEHQVTGVVDIAPYGGSHGLRLDTTRDVLISSVESGCGAAGGVIGIDLKTHKIIGSVASESRSHWVVVRPDGKKAYTCNKTDDWVSVLDLENWTFIKKIPVSGSEELDISLDGRFVYVPTPSAQFTSPAVDPCLKVIDTTTDEIVKSIPLPHGPSSIHVTSRDTIMIGQYVFDVGSSSLAKHGRLSLFEPETFKLLGDVEIGRYPLTNQSSADGSVAYNADIFGGIVTVVDLEKFEVLRSIDVDTEQRADKAGHQGAHGMVVFG